MKPYDMNYALKSADLEFSMLKRRRLIWAQGYEIFNTERQTTYAFTARDDTYVYPFMSDEVAAQHVLEELVRKGRSGNLTYRNSSLLRLANTLQANQHLDIDLQIRLIGDRESYTLSEADVDAILEGGVREDGVMPWRRTPSVLGLSALDTAAVSESELRRFQIVARDHDIARMWCVLLQVGHKSPRLALVVEATQPNAHDEVARQLRCTTGDAADNQSDSGGLDVLPLDVLPRLKVEKLGLPVLPGQVQQTWFDPTEIPAHSLRATAHVLGAASANIKRAGSKIRFARLRLSNQYGAVLDRAFSSGSQPMPMVHRARDCINGALQYAMQGHVTHAKQKLSDAEDSQLVTDILCTLCAILGKKFVDPDVAVYYHIAKNLDLSEDYLNKVPDLSHEALMLKKNDSDAAQDFFLAAIASSFFDSSVGQSLRYALVTQAARSVHRYSVLPKSPLDTARRYAMTAATRDDSSVRDVADSRLAEVSAQVDHLGYIYARKAYLSTTGLLADPAVTPQARLLWVQIAVAAACAARYVFGSEPGHDEIREFANSIRGVAGQEEVYDRLSRALTAHMNVSLDFTETDISDTADAVAELLRDDALDLDRGIYSAQLLWVIFIELTQRLSQDATTRACAEAGYAAAACEAALIFGRASDASLFDTFTELSDA